MKKLKIYLDTSVISYLLQPDTPEKMEETRRFCWRKCMMEMKEPTISERFDVDDIRKIREYNAARYKNMTTEEIIREIHEGRKWF